jgi:hypothetical protein
MSTPSLINFAATFTFDENRVNAIPQLLDVDVTFTDADGDFDGGTLSLTGLLAEDTVSVRSQGFTAGQIGLVVANVSFGGTVIGTLAGGTGTKLTITFNAAATSVSIDALIQNLTYANSSDAPTASRDLLLNVTDAAGANMAPPASFAALTGAANPFNGIDLFNNGVVDLYYTPSFVDLDGDGDFDLVMGEFSGALRSFANDGAGAFTALTGAANPFGGFAPGFFSAPSVVDLDGDGDLDLVVGDFDGTLRSFANEGAGAFTALTGAANPYAGIDVGFSSSPSFVDLDGDGDLDLVVGNSFGKISIFVNNGAGHFSTLTGAANPFAGIDVGDKSSPSFVDLDADGDLDLVIGEDFGTLFSFANDGVGAFTALTGAANPFAGIDVGGDSAPSFVDLDGDGDLDLVVGAYDGTLVTYENTTPRGIGFTVAIIPENDAQPVLTGLPRTVIVTEDAANDLDLSALTLSDATKGRRLPWCAAFVHARNT